MSTQTTRNMIPLNSRTSGNDGSSKKEVPLNSCISGSDESSKKKHGHVVHATVVSSATYSIVMLLDKSASGLTWASDFYIAAVRPKHSLPCRDDTAFLCA